MTGAHWEDECQPNHRIKPRHLIVQLKSAGPPMSEEDQELDDDLDEDLDEDGWEEDTDEEGL